MKKLTESKKIIIEEIEGFEEVISDKEEYQKIRSMLKDKEQERADYPLEEIDRNREDKRYKKGVKYYLLNPQEFDFGLKDL